MVHNLRAYPTLLIFGDSNGINDGKGLSETIVVENKSLG